MDSHIDFPKTCFNRIKKLFTFLKYQNQITLLIHQYELEYLIILNLNVQCGCYADSSMLREFK